MGSLSNNQMQYNQQPLYVLPSVFSIADQQEYIPPKSDPMEKQTAEKPVYTPNTNVYYTGLDPNATKEYVAEVFSKFGPIVDSKILIDRSLGQSRGAGLVRFETKEQAERAIRELNGVVLPNSINGAPMVLRFADTPEEKLRKTTRRMMNQGREVYGGGMRYNPMHSPTYTGHVFIPSAPTMPQNPLPEPYIPPPGYPVVYLPPGAASNLPQPSISPFSLYVANLPPETDDTLVAQMFSQFGPILSVKVTRTEDGSTCKGYGFVNFWNAQDASNAVATMNGMMISGKPLIVSFKSWKSN